MPGLRPAVVAAGAGLLAAAAVWVATLRHGPGVSPDSAIYLSAAEHLAAGRGLVSFDGEPLVAWAPLYPALLAVAGWIGLSPLDVARAGNALAAGLTAALAAVWLSACTVTRPWLLGGTLAVALSPVLLYTAAFVWSEALFAAFVLGALTTLGHREGKSVPWLSVTLAALAALTRYAGVAVALAGAMALLLGGARDRRGRLRQAAIYLVASLAPVALWLVRNHLTHGTAAGVRAPSAYPWWENLRFSAEVLGGWLMPHAVPGSVRAAVAAGMVAAVGFLWLALRRHAVQPAAGAPLLPLALGAYALLHLVLTVAASSTVALERIDDRYLAPLFVPVALLASVALDRVTRDPATARRIGVRLLVAAAGTILALLVTRSGIRVARYGTEGVGGYTTPAWRSSPTAERLRSAPPATALYSNAPDAVCALAGLDCKMSPRRHAYSSPRAVTADLADLVARTDAGERGTLVWWDAIERPFLHPPVALDSVLALEPLWREADGAAYALGPRSGAPSGRLPGGPPAPP